MNDELIAAIMAEEETEMAATDSMGYMFGVGDYDDPADDDDDDVEDYAPGQGGKGRSQRKNAAKSGSTKKNKGTTSSSVPAPIVTTVLSSSGPVTDNNGVTSATSGANATNAAGKQTPVAKGNTTAGTSGHEYRSGLWQPDEEALFLEALELHGRDWGKVQEHIKFTRSKPNISSHAQKHFIMLYKNGKPVPKKVAETGSGHTLSGKPLDPRSSSAARLLYSKSERIAMGIEPTKKRKAGEPAADGASEPAAIAEPPETPGASSIKPNKQTKTAIQGDAGDGKESGTANASKKAKKARAKPRKDELSLPGLPDALAGGVLPDTSHLTDDSFDRLVENLRAQQAAVLNAYQLSQYFGTCVGYESYMNSIPARRRSLTYSEVSYSQTGPLTMVRCREFDSSSESRTTLRQPFDVSVHTNALFVMDFHSHLDDNEVIGLLAGTLDESGTKITVVAAYPCRSLSNCSHSKNGTLESAPAAGNSQKLADSAAHPDQPSAPPTVLSAEDNLEMNVEMDPTSQIEMREVIEKAGLRVVGWYHSHPTFQPDPSVKDIRTQTEYQQLFKDPESGKQPFIGMIVATYDQELPNNWSIVNSFIANTTNETADGKKRERRACSSSQTHLPCPMFTAVSVVSDPQLTDRERGAVDELLSSCNSDARVHFDRVWRYRSPLERVFGQMQAGRRSTESSAVEPPANKAATVDDSVKTEQPDDNAAAVPQETAANDGAADKKDDRVDVKQESSPTGAPETSGVAEAPSATPSTAQSKTAAVLPDGGANATVHAAVGPVANPSPSGRVLFRDKLASSVGRFLPQAPEEQSWFAKVLERLWK